MQLFVTIGLLYAYAIGPFVSYVAFAIVCAIPPVVFFGCFFMMPESPYHLLKIGKREEAVQALAKLRKKSPASVQKEADEIQVREIHAKYGSLTTEYRRAANSLEPVVLVN